MKGNRKELAKSVFKEFFQERSFMHGAALAYYAILALVPLLYLSMTFFGRIVGHERMVEIIANLLHDQVGIKDVSGILGFLDEIDLTGSNVVLEIIGVLALMLSSTAIITSLKNSLNEFYDLEPRQDSTRKKIVRGLLFRLISMCFIVGTTVVIVIFYFAQTVFLSIEKNWFENSEFFGHIISMITQYGLPILTNVIIFSFIFKYCHDGKVQWRRAMEGAFLTSLLLYLGQLIIKFYLLNYFFAANGGVAGSFLIILVWVYYSSQIIFLGAKFIAVKSRKLDNPIIYRD